MTCCYRRMINVTATPLHHTTLSLLISLQQRNTEFYSYKFHIIYTLKERESEINRSLCLKPTTEP